MAHQEGGHRAQQDGGAREVGLLSGTRALSVLPATALCCDCLVLLELPVDDDVEGEQGEEGQKRGGGHPGPSGVPHDVILNESQLMSNVSLLFST